MYTPLRCAYLFIIVIGLTLCLTKSVYADNAADIALIDKFMKQDGIPFQKNKDGDAWYVHIQGDNMEQIVENVGIKNGLMVIYVTVAKSGEIPHSEELEYKILKMNNEFDYIKMSIDDIGDLDVRSDVSVRVLDAPELEYLMRQLASSADEIYGDIKPFLIRHQ